MEILHNLWNVVSTEDEKLTKYVVLSLVFIETYVTMKFFTTSLNIEYSKRRRNVYIILISILTVLSNIFIPKQISLFIHLILTPILIKVIFKTTIIKSILCEIIPMILLTLLETI